MRPTARTRTLLIAALILYFFANQTQVGWLYVMAALMLGIVLAAALINLGMLGGVGGSRSLSIDEIHEGDPVSVTLTLAQGRGAPASQIRTMEVCPLADPDSPQRGMDIFIPHIPGRGGVSFTYDTTAYRRGLHSFEPLALASQAPFGLFLSRRSLPIETRALVYPEVIRLPRLSLLDRQPAAQQTRQRAGQGSEVIGVRPFRPGDSPRHIHWRSVARTQMLMSKEFADEAHPGVTIVLDLFRHPYPLTAQKHTPFEWGIKAAASIADYAMRRKYALHMAADRGVMPLPPGPLSWDALMQYLARIDPLGAQPLSDLLPAHTYQTFVAVIIPWPTQDVIAPLLGLRHRGLDVLSVVLDPASFPAGGPSAGPLVDSLRAAELEAVLLQYGRDFKEQLSEASSRQPAAEPIGEVL